MNPTMKAQMIVDLQKALVALTEASRSTQEPTKKKTLDEARSHLVRALILIDK